MCHTCTTTPNYDIKVMVTHTLHQNMVTHLDSGSSCMALLELVPGQPSPHAPLELHHQMQHLLVPLLGRMSSPLGLDDARRTVLPPEGRTHLLQGREGSGGEKGAWLQS